MKKFLLLTAIMAFSLPFFSQQYIYIDEEGVRKVLRVELGYAQWSMEQQDSNSRIAKGVHLHNEVKIFSLFTPDNGGFAIHDAFYFGMDMGVLSGKQHSTGVGEDIEKESKFSVNINMGYLGMLGYRRQKWAALAGMDFRWRAARIGDLTMPNIDGPLFYMSTPLVARLEYGMAKADPDFRIILTAWSTLASTKRTPYQSFRLEFPLSKAARWWFCAQYSAQEALSEDAFLFTPASQTKFNNFWIGVRVGNLP